MKDQRITPSNCTDNQIVVKYEFASKIIYVSSMQRAMFSVLIPLLYSRPWEVNEKLSRWLSYLAQLTYPVFLFHVPVYILCTGFQKRIFPDYSAIFVVLAVVITIVLSEAAIRIQRN